MPALRRRLWVAAVLLGGGAFIGLGLVADLTPEPLDKAALPATLDLTWAVAAQFGAPNRPAEVIGATRWSDQIIAVGTQYEAPLPEVGVLPARHGLVWTSTDGLAWDIAEPESFDDVRLLDVYVAADGSLVTVAAAGRFTVPMTRHEFWRSTDGRNWQRIDTGIPEAVHVREVRRGPRGYLLFARIQEHDEFWFSGDGLTWELTRDSSRVGIPGEILWDVAAGDSGFVAVGETSVGDSEDPLALVSANGRDWVESPFPPWLVWTVAPVGTGWEAAELTGPIVEGMGGEAAVWRSGTGLVWQQIGAVSLASLAVGPELRCREYAVDLVSAGGWRLISTDLGGGCTDGGPHAFGRPRISVDGVRWEPLPFPEFSFDAETLKRHEGSVVHDAIALPQGLLLAGQSDGRATFWLGEPE